MFFDIGGFGFCGEYSVGTKIDEIIFLVCEFPLPVSGHVICMYAIHIST